MKYTTYNPRPYEIHHLALTKVGVEKRVLELGCATGYITKILKKNNCFVTAVDANSEAILQTKQIADEVIQADLNEPQSLNIKKKYSVVLLMDVIEHLINREELLQNIKKWLGPDGVLILSTPNIAHIRVRLNLLRGKFTYTEIGIMDSTHVHFYTKDTLLTELNKTGFSIKECIGSADLGQIPLFGRWLRHIPKHIQFMIVSLFPTLLAVQWLVIAEKK
jgi:2-polyprenyl-3-methyl-5-hydroxy-6-metoxy-1,4-benzoquinol methylase